MTTLSIAQIVVSILLIIGILMQSRGGGLSSMFGGGGGGDAYRTKRGAEKFIFRATIVLAVLFLLISAARLFV
ncbi:MAG TPA: preprotein translocase subunit SecG [Patescibacteria group bacterium]|nr:preprotein translocase subunit SecG [Patescibacteria group bacterium]